jgi:uncharacterized membrane protein HdeD (DUF308 family)
MTPEIDPFTDIQSATILTKLRKGFLWGGVVMIALGTAAVFMPLFSSLVVEIFIGWLLVVSGGVAVVGALSLRGTGLFVWQLISGLISLAAGLLMLVFPFHGLVALTVLIAVVLVLTGAAQMAFAFWARPASGWVWGLASAAVSIALGGYIFVALPQASAVILGLLVGFDFISTGMALVLISRSARQNLGV